MGWVEDREAQMRPAPRENYCLDCGKSHERRPFLTVVTAEHRRLYLADAYACPVPPVPTMLWDADAWCRWIEQHGAWTFDPLRADA